MNNRTHIEKELQSIAPGLVPLPVAMPYTVPQNYFYELASEIFSVLKVEPEPLLVLNRTIPYTIPDGYFEQLPQFILQKLHSISASEKELDFWGQFSKTTPYTVPPGYFDNLPAIVLRKIKRAEQPQSVPAGYFETLPELLLAKVRTLDTGKELEEIAPLLNNISRQPVQHIPAGYFDSLEPIINLEQSSIPVVSIRKKASWLKYAVAASIILLFSFGAYFLFTNSNTVVPSIANQPTVNVINKELASLDASAIEDYLKTTNSVTQTALPAGGVYELSTGDLDELLQGFTDQQIKEHIEATPELPTVTRLKTHT